MLSEYQICVVEKCAVGRFAEENVALDRFCQILLDMGEEYRDYVPQIHDDFPHHVTLLFEFRRSKNKVQKTYSKTVDTNITFQAVLAARCSSTLITRWYT